MLGQRSPRVVAELGKVFATDFPSGAWRQPPREAVIFPIPSSGETGRTGFLIAGLSPFRLFDDNYAGFLDLVARQIGAAVANAEAYEQKRRRADALAALDNAKTLFFSTSVMSSARRSLSCCRRLRKFSRNLAMR